MMDDTIVIVHTISNWLTLPIGVIANSLLIWLCKDVNENQIRHDRWILTSTAIIELFECVDLVALQVGLFDNSGVGTVVIMGVVSHAPTFAVIILYAIYVFIFLIRSWVFSLGFIYKYAIICGKQWLLICFSKRYFKIVVVAIALTSALQDAAFLTSVNLRRAEVDSAFPVVHNIIEITLHVKSYWKLGAVCILFSACFCINYVIVAYTSRNLCKWLTSNAISSQTRALQKQFTILMITQAMLPLIFTLTPAFFFIVTFFGNPPAARYLPLSFALINWQTCFHPLFSLWFIRPLRERVVNLVYGVPARVAPMAVATVNNRNISVTLYH